MNDNITNIIEIKEKPNEPNLSDNRKIMEFLE